MMQTEQGQTDNLTSNVLVKPAEPRVQLNSQGMPIEVTAESVPVDTQPALELLESSYEDISLWDTPLEGPLDTLCEPTDDTGLVHQIISCGHVLKSTHDLARWSEKTGARRVNSQESIDAINDMCIRLEAPRESVVDTTKTASAGGSAARNNGKYGSNRRTGAGSWKLRPGALQGPGAFQDSARWPEKKSVNFADSAGLLNESAVSTQGGSQTGGSRVQNAGGRQRDLGGQQTTGQPVSQGTSRGPLKPTHDAPTWPESKGAKVVESGSQDLTPKATQAGGSSLQSGLDTQAGSHIQLDGQKGSSETPEKAMAALHLHV